MKHNQLLTDYILRQNSEVSHNVYKGDNSSGLFWTTPLGFLNVLKLLGQILIGLAVLVNLYLLLVVGCAFSDQCWNSYQGVHYESN
tara:strand:+ start:1994 stop:2251 length:258 start_codon:yes stop_codon:yes gene_type:complete